MAAAASLPALDWHARQDRAALLAHNRALTARIIEAAEDAGLPLVTPRPETARGGSVMLRLADPATAQRQLQTLREADLHADVRGATLRLSPGFVTTADGTDRLIQSLQNLRHP